MNENGARLVIEHVIRRGDQDEDERGEKNPDRRSELPQEAPDDIADKGRRDDNRAGADHIDRDGDEELALIEPAVIVERGLIREKV
jgi:hypothetical protein